MLMHFVLLGVVLSIMSISFIFKKEYRKKYLPIHQGIANKLGTMNVKDIEDIIVQQFYYFLRKNKKTPFIIKYNILILLPLYILLVWLQIIPLKIGFLTLLGSTMFLPFFSIALAETYMYLNISQEYVDLFWEQYLKENEWNKLKVVVHHAYTPKESSHLKAMWSITFSFFVGLVYCQFVTLSL